MKRTWRIFKFTFLALVISLFSSSYQKSDFLISSVKADAPAPGCDGGGGGGPGCIGGDFGGGSDGGCAGSGTGNGSGCCGC